MVPTVGADLTQGNRNLLTFIEMDCYNPVSNASVPLKTHKNVCIVPTEAKYTKQKTNKTTNKQKKANFGLKANNALFLICRRWCGKINNCSRVSRSQTEAGVNHFKNSYKTENCEGNTYWFFKGIGEIAFSKWLLNWTLLCAITV